MASELARKLSHYLDLTGGERAVLAQLETHERRLRAGEVLVREGEETEHLFIVRSGWLHASARLVTGDRQILRFHYVGDLMGMSSIAWAHTAATLTAITDAVVSPFPRHLLGRVFAVEPRLAGMLYAVASAEAVAMSDRLASLGRADARARLSTMLLGMLTKLRLADPRMTDSFTLPLTQTELGDAAGLTKVHVNRTLRDMEAAGTIERKGRTVRIVNEAALRDATGYQDRLDHIATDWLPDARGGTSGVAAE